MKKKKPSVQEELDETVKQLNHKMMELGPYAENLYNTLTLMQASLSRISSLPSSQELEIKESKQVSNRWKTSADQIKSEFDQKVVKEGGKAFVQMGAEAGIAYFGPQCAMSTATIFGTAGTGAKIAGLAGAAQKNAALAWLGGGPLAAGGGGMELGAFVLNAIPVVGILGLALSGTIAATIIAKNVNTSKQTKAMFEKIQRHEIHKYQLATQEIEKRIACIKQENIQLLQAINVIDSLQSNYFDLSESQQYALGSYVNYMKAANALLVEPVLSLDPKFSKEKLDSYCKANKITLTKKEEGVILAAGNMMVNAPLTLVEKKLLWDCLRHDKQFLSPFMISTKEMNDSLFDVLQEVLMYQKCDA